MSMSVESACDKSVIKNEVHSLTLTSSQGHIFKTLKPLKVSCFTRRTGDCTNIPQVYGAF